MDSGHRVTLIARGARYSQIRQHGFRVGQFDDDTKGLLEFNYRVGQQKNFNLCRPEEKQPAHDVVFIATKDRSLTAALAQSMKSGLIGEKTIVIPAVNGIPPWFPYRQTQILPYVTGPNLERLNAIASVVPLEQVAGVSLGFAVDVIAPATVIALGPGRVDVGSICEGQTNLKGLPSLLSDISNKKISFNVAKNIRKNVWQKLCLNSFVNTWGCYGWQIGELDRNAQVWGHKLLDEVFRLGECLGVVAEADKAEALQFVHKALSSDGMKKHFPSTWTDVRDLKVPEFFAIYASPLLYAAAYNRVNQELSSSFNPISYGSLLETYRLALSGVVQCNLQRVANADPYLILRGDKIVATVPHISPTFDFSSIDVLWNEYCEVIQAIGANPRELPNLDSPPANNLIARSPRTRLLSLPR